MNRDPSSRWRLSAAFLALCGFGIPAFAQQWVPASYDMGDIVVQDVWVDPVAGHDANSGASSNLALRAVTEAWNRIPMGADLSGTGYRLRLLPGVHSNVPNYWESRHGTATHPILLVAEGPAHSAILPDPNIFDCSHLYFVGLFFDKTTPGGDGFHLEQCRHVLLRNCIVAGNGLARETIKVNQSRHIYIEDCDISGADDNAVDFVAVQYGHILRSRIHGAGDWALYVKGGSAGILIEGNEVFNAGTGGITAGQGTGFEFMTPPWLHYEAYDIKIANNFIHDTEGAGLGVNGGYNILMAHNTLVRVGERSHVIEVVHGMRGCDGDPVACESNRLAGGWGTTGEEFQYIPNRNVYIYNNVVFNPPPYQSQWQHFAIHGPRTPPPGSNVSSPALADDNLRIRGNLIWNGPPDHPVLGDSGGCTNGNPTCHEAQLLADNHLNTLFPHFVDAAGGDYRPAVTGNLFKAATYAIPNFPGEDRPFPPLVPEGELANEVPRARHHYPRHGRTGPPGAYTGGSSLRLLVASPDVLQLHGEAGYPYAIESSGDFLAWSGHGTVNHPSQDVIAMAPPSTNAIRYYRARLLPPQ
jgi:hypothetical protein